MFDSKIPNNELKKLPLDFDFNDIDLLKQLNKTNIAITRLNWVAKEIPNQDILLEFISVKESVQSNKIENIHTTVTEVFQSELIQDKTKIRYEDKEAINYKAAIKYWYDTIKKRWGLWFNDILKLNEIIIEKSTWIVSSPNKKVEKELPNWDKEILYTPPVWVDLIKDLLYNLEEYYNKFDEDIEIDPLLKLPIIHYQFEAIHPFWDWNWRVWRIMVVLYLCLYWKLDVPILYLSDFVIKNKSDYYEYLNKIDRWLPWSIKNFILWLLIWIEIQSLNTQNNITKIKILRLDLKIKLKKDKDFKKIYSKELMDFLFVRPFYTYNDMAIYLRKHRLTAVSYLNLLEKKWILRSFLSWRKKIFVFDEFLELLDWVK